MSIDHAVVASKNEEWKIFLIASARYKFFNLCYATLTPNRASPALSKLAPGSSSLCWPWKITVSPSFERKKVPPFLVWEFHLTSIWADIEISIYGCGSGTAAVGRRPSSSLWCAICRPPWHLEALWLYVQVPRDAIGDIRENPSSSHLSKAPRPRHPLFILPISGVSANKKTESDLIRTRRSIAYILKIVENPRMTLSTTRVTLEYTPLSAPLPSQSLRAVSSQGSVESPPCHEPEQSNYLESCMKWARFSISRQASIVTAVTKLLSHMTSIPLK